jgi:hypothetical protein
MNLNKTAYYNLEVPFSGTISVGYVRSGLFGQSPKGIFTTENPYLKVDDMNVLIVTEPVKWYQKWYVPIIAGAVGIETVRFLLK